jgi:hypothetical protein
VLLIWKEFEFLGGLAKGRIKSCINCIVAQVYMEINQILNMCDLVKIMERNYVKSF